MLSPSNELAIKLDLVIFFVVNEKKCKFFFPNLAQ
jgi:hypothetical protein